MTHSFPIPVRQCVIGFALHQGMRHAMKENRERKRILFNNIENLRANESASGRPCAEPLVVPKWRIISFKAAESVPFTELFQKGIVRPMLAAPDRE